MIPGWMAEAARAFWADAGEPPPYPRDLEGILPYALPVAQVVLPALAIDAIDAWLRRHGLACRLDERNRRVRGGLVAFDGHGVAFVDGADRPEERRFTVAHEAAHFLVDYLKPRARAIRLLGEGISPVLDGERPPTQAERLDAALTNCPLGVHVHLLDRRDPMARLATIESRADQLACELLAPDEELACRFGDDVPDEDELAAVLIEAYGLPAPEAASYARRWVRARRPVSLAGGLWT